jgi:hypothetical protein
MLIIDKFRRRESKRKVLSLSCNRFDAEHIDPRKIIDFESARQALERDRSRQLNGEQVKRSLLGRTRTEASTGVAESLVTIVLALVIGLSLLLGLIWGF